MWGSFFTGQPKWKISTIYMQPILAFVGGFTKDGLPGRSQSIAKLSCETWPRTDGSSSGLVDHCRWTNSCRHTGITRKRGAYKKDIYIYIFIYCNYVGGHPWAINRLEAIASSNKKATRWRPSLLGWTPSLLATRTVRHFTCAQLGFKVVAWDQL